MLVLWWRVQVGHGTYCSGAQPKELASDFTHRHRELRAHTYIMVYAMHYAARSSRGEQPFW
eukprot:7037923-Prymnesium_polylepis.1